MDNTDKIRLVFFLLISGFGLSKNYINTDANLDLLSKIHSFFFFSQGLLQLSDLTRSN